MNAPGGAFDIYREPLEGTEPAGVLLVDDQPDNLLSAEAVLESLGEEIIKAESGREALRRLLERDFAVILLDIMMPDMDGFETAELIRHRERSRNTPIVFLTALGRTEQHMLRGYGVGAVDYIVKPFVPEILRAKVGIFVELARKTALLRRHAALLSGRNIELQRALERERKGEREISELNRHLERRIEALADVNRELEAFSFTVSHHLRSPLTRIAGFSKALQDSYADRLDETGRRYLDRIGASATHTCELIEELLNFARVGRAALERSNVDLTGMARAIADELRNRDPGRQVEFLIREHLRAWGDVGLLRLALLNLLENAWKFTARREAARIEFGAEGSRGMPCFFVRDNGAGFDMAHAGELFLPFGRLHKNADFEGAGIGLATVARVVARHNGRIWAEGIPGQGAVFYFTLETGASQ